MPSFAHLCVERLLRYLDAIGVERIALITIPWSRCWPGLPNWV